ncbi:MAG: 1-deoxy-D-xylulose-5-phosphate reductoisomerase [bacterium]
MREKPIILLGATGSIGSSTLDIVRALPGKFRICGLSTHRRVPELVSLAREFRPDAVAVADTSAFRQAKSELFGIGVEVLAGEEGLCKLAAWPGVDRVVNAVVGAAGIRPTFEAIRARNQIAIANKETLVAAGPLILKAARDRGVNVLPIDSEHSAIWQCLQGEASEHVRAIWLTTSGGPVFDIVETELEKVTPAIALAHPTWRMGPKITIDSATLMNKGLEVIEAHHLFSVPPERIRVIVHRQSIIHSLVEFRDGSFKAQLSKPDMRLPILYALGYPERLESNLVPTKLADTSPLTFEEVPEKKFPALELAYQALNKGGTAPAALSAADEVAVGAFLEGEIAFTEIPRVLAAVLAGWPDEPLDSIDHVLDADARARQLVSEESKKLRAQRTSVKEKIDK